MQGKYDLVFYVEDLTKNPKEAIKVEANFDEKFLEVLRKILQQVSSHFFLNEIAIIPRNGEPLTYLQVHLSVGAVMDLFHTREFRVLPRLDCNGPDLTLPRVDAATLDGSPELYKSQFEELVPPPKLIPPHPFFPASSGGTPPPPPPPGTAPPTPGGALPQPIKPVTLRGSIMDELKDLFDKRGEEPSEASIDHAKVEKAITLPPQGPPHSPPQGPPSGMPQAAPASSSHSSKKSAFLMEQELSRLKKLMRSEGGAVSSTVSTSQEENLPVTDELVPTKEKKTSNVAEFSEAQKEAASLLYSMTDTGGDFTGGNVLDVDSFLKDEPVSQGDLKHTAKVTEGFGKPTDEMKTTSYNKNIAVDYFDRMNPENYYPIVVNIADLEQVTRGPEENILTGERKIQTKEKISIDLESPIVTVRPIFPGCMMTPAEVITDFRSGEDELTFYCTPLVKGKVEEGRIDFVNSKKEVFHSIATPAKVDDPRYAKSVAAYGALASVAPKGLSLFGIAATTAMTNIIAGIGVVIAFFTSMIIYRIRQPNPVKIAESMSKIGNIKEGT